jgi:2-aminoadipate transaminase
MGNIFSDRISDVPRSFIREILKIAGDRTMISFAGGLPNRELFPLDEIKEATLKVFVESGKDALQYSNSEGFLPLREWIAERYRKIKNLDISPDQILITSGSQQGLDLLGKTLLNEGDSVAMEGPGYLGAIQAFSVYKATFHQIPMEKTGIKLEPLDKALTENTVKILYTVPNFQNPSGITYTLEKRHQVADVVRKTDTILVEDDPYGELRFFGEHQPSFYSMIPENTVLLGSFSKIIVPSLRIGWIVARQDILEKLIIAKQASDLHSNYLGQRIIYQYLKDYDVDAHIGKIIHAYGKQREAMVNAIHRYFPKEISFTEPEGGMFLWVTLPETLSSMQLFNHAVKEKIAFVPGNPFFFDNRETPSLRLNFSCVDEKTIETGIRKLAKVITGILK